MVEVLSNTPATGPSFQSTSVGMEYHHRGKGGIGCTALLAVDGRTLAQRTLVARQIDGEIRKHCVFLPLPVVFLHRAESDGKIEANFYVVQKR